MIAALLLLSAGCAPRGVVADSGLSPEAPLSGRAVVTSPDEAADLDGDTAVVHVALTASAMTHTITAGDESWEIEGYAYNGQTPGPTIRARVGDTVIVDLENDLDVETTIHWHGLEVPNDMDGVAWIFEPVPAGGAFTYTFTLEQAGTFWYHPHIDTLRQVDLGLYGAFGLEGLWTLNGAAALGTWQSTGDPDAEPPSAEVVGGEAVRVRLINASNVGYAKLAWDDLALIGGDQGLLSALWAPDSALLAPGDRADALWLPGASDFTVSLLGYTHQGGASWESPRALLDVTVTDPTTPAASPDWPFSGEETPDDPGTTDVLYTFSGDTASGEWFINGEQFPDVTVGALALDQPVVLEVRNVSPTEHPFHVHGMSFDVLSIDGEPPEIPMREDTINVGIYGVVRLLVRPEEAGDWMAHCHLLPHADGGMMTVLRVE